MKVYIAAPFAAQSKVDGYLTELEQIGFERSCRWATEESQDGEFNAEAQRIAANFDLYDIRSADVLVLLTARAAFPAEVARSVTGQHYETPTDRELAYDTRSGGRLVEMGYALGRNIPVVVVGEPENIFAHLSTVTVVPDWHAATLHLAATLIGERRNTPHHERI